MRLVGTGRRKCDGPSTSAAPVRCRALSLIKSPWSCAAMLANSIGSGWIRVYPSFRSRDAGVCLLGA